MFYKFKILSLQFQILNHNNKPQGYIDPTFSACGVRSTIKFSTL
jgi:hypothetical protein